jgi:hypothetical protein
MSICTVFVSNKPYFNKFINTCNQLITNGNYTGDICLVIGDDLINSDLLKCNLIVDNNIIIKHFPDIIFSDDFLEINNKVKSDGRNLTKKFQWHKMYLFHTYFKQWDYIFYLDCGTNVFSDIKPILNEIKENTLFAHSDAYPKYEWKLIEQFCNHNTELYTKLNETYTLNIDYFQTTIMLYDTKIINENTFTELLNLTFEYPISKTNEQAIMALYFTNIKPLFKQIKTHNEDTHFYDYMTRNKENKYIILKMA